VSAHSGTIDFVTSRAAALPPDERRAAIVSAALPLLLDRGASVSTREIAEAAGIAEGTIFGVFPCKDAVIQAAFLAAIDPLPTNRSLAEIDRTASFEEQLVAAVSIIEARYSKIWRLISSVGDAGAPRTPPTDFPALVEILERQRDRLRTDPSTAARQLRALTLAVSNPVFFPGTPMKPEEIVTMFLDGVIRPHHLAGGEQGT
jgi:AcrR family transcriptional regulator